VPAIDVNTFSPAVNGQFERILHAHLGETFPALALAVVHRGALCLNAAWGWLDPITRRYPTRPDSLFDLASVSKLFTASAFLSLVSAGRIALDDPLVRVIPEFDESGPRPLDGGQDPHTKVRLATPESARGQMADPGRVTFYHLLTHTAGIAPWRDVYNAAGPAPTPPDQVNMISQPVRWARALDALCQYPFVGQPGEGIVRYSDLGLMLLGEAVSRLYHDAKVLPAAPGRSGFANPPLHDALHALIFTPLDLPSLTFNPLQHERDRHTIAPTENDPGWRGRRCWGEVHDENACGVGGVAGHAGLFGTARDVAAFGQAWLDADPRLNVAPDLRQAAIGEREQTDGMRRGLGWMIKAFQDSSAGDLFSPDSYGHTGFTGTSLWVDPDRALVVVCLTNRVYPGREKEGIHAFRRAIHDAIVQAVEETC
jgi:CubicO group peptidase (beta-lactamase class C family)